MFDLAAHSDHAGRRKTHMILTERIFEPALAGLLSNTPRGVDATLTTLLAEVDGYRPNVRSSAGDVAALIRIFLLSQIDALWWGRVPPFHDDLDVLNAPDLVDLDTLAPGIRHRRQAVTFASRVWRAAERRITPDRTPRTAGLRFTRIRPEAVALLDRLRVEFGRLAPAGTPPLWVTSLTRSVTHQHHLRTLGYPAVLPSSHCTGYGVDIEMAWYRRWNAHHVLQRLLLDRQQTGDVNVIDEGQAWHVCISPTAVGALRRDFDARFGG
jgi:hypothetical protein